MSRFLNKACCVQHGYNFNLIYFIKIRTNYDFKILYKLSYIKFFSEQNPIYVNNKMYTNVSLDKTKSDVNNIKDTICKQVTSRCDALSNTKKFLCVAQHAEEHMDILGLMLCL